MACGRRKIDRPEYGNLKAKHLSKRDDQDGKIGREVRS
jgi:hypothetical protein